MSSRKFTWCQDLESNSQTNTFRTLTSKFGDGYEQNVSVGINNKSGQWQYSKTGKKALIQEIKAFFDDHKGADSFLWDSPLDGEVRVKASDYQPVCLSKDIWRITTTFTQVFHP
ncbi:phage tail protein [Acinetobacter colistiniresistens]|uniref:Phage tail protein n=1 Tax=Acinetobacter colistiniresistens TaxID=280145 RepID=A0A558EZ33_9GAMM|nr:phage tail protein [Acinetobacter colistiniresistens]TVT78616.1 phage tail protein [Acinetobacter colistiniresistens]